MTLSGFDRLPEDERQLWIAEWQAGRLACGECGRPIAECADPGVLHYPYRRVCYVSREAAAAEAMYSRLHEDAPFHDGTYADWAKVRSASHPYHFSDGVHIGVADRDIAPHDQFTTDVNASPVPSADSPTVEE